MVTSAGHAGALHDDDAQAPVTPRPTRQAEIVAYACFPGGSVTARHAIYATQCDTWQTVAVQRLAPWEGFPMSGAIRLEPAVLRRGRPLAGRDAPAAGQDGQGHHRASCANLNLGANLVS